jgi:ABC-type bacteriocin/lantibiotic exporter with double-glycine peptidase domain
MSARRRRHLFATLALMLVGAAAEIIGIGAVIPFLALITNASSRLIPEGLRHILAMAPGGPVVGAALLLATAGVTVAVVRLWLLWTSQSLAMAWGGELATLVFGRMLRQPYSAYLERNSSEFLAGLEKVNRVVGGILQPALQGMIALVLALCIAALLFAFRPLAAIIAAVFIGSAYGLTIAFTRRRLAANSILIAREMTSRTQTAREALGGIRDVLLDRSQPAFDERFSAVEMTTRSAMAHNAFIVGAPRFISRWC